MVVLIVGLADRLWLLGVDAMAGERVTSGRARGDLAAAPGRQGSAGSKLSAVGGELEAIAR